MYDIIKYTKQTIDLNYKIYICVCVCNWNSNMLINNEIIKKVKNKQGNK